MGLYCFVEFMCLVNNKKHTNKTIDAFALIVDGSSFIFACWHEKKKKKGIRGE